MKRFVLGVISTLVLLFIGTISVIWFGLFPANADVSYLPGEEWGAKRDVRVQMRREMPQPPYPYGPATDAVLLAGAKLYQQNCAFCHGSGGTPVPRAVQGMYIKAPQLAKHGVDDDPEGSTYWKIEHGYRFTAMPSYKGVLTEAQIWQITYFLKRPSAQLPASAKAIWNEPLAGAK